MSDKNSYQIITFYQFRRLPASELPGIRGALKRQMARLGIKGTIILATEGYNSTLCGRPESISHFMAEAEAILCAQLQYTSSFHRCPPFRRIDVKIKAEIVTLKRPVDISRGAGTHIAPQRWNDLIREPDVYILDARNDYEWKNGTFRGAVNPRTARFSELPEFAATNLDPTQHTKIAMFCTGGIRCEKFVPFMKQLGFREVYQLEGGILKYLEEVPPQDSLWQGECFVFDDRITVDRSLKKGTGPDHSRDRAK